MKTINIYTLRDINIHFLVTIVTITISKYIELNNYFLECSISAAGTEKYWDERATVFFASNSWVRNDHSFLEGLWWMAGTKEAV